MKIVSWNINSIKARLEHVLTYINNNEPHTLFLQELKGIEFPTSTFKEINYNSVHISQKAYNGVAILSKSPITLIKDRLDGEDADEQARYLEVDIETIRLINIYLPNGTPLPGDKFDYKLRWMQRLYDRLADLTLNDIPFIIGGDFNIIPEIKDCENSKDWENDALFHPQSRAAYHSLLNLGLTDALRIYNSSPKQYTFWDYQRGAWQKNNGIRIDHFLLSPIYADKMISCKINKTPRGWDSASDHTPIELEIC